MRQFHDQIQYSYPIYKKFFYEIECETSLTFYEMYPSASTLEHTTIEELQSSYESQVITAILQRKQNRY